jgi:hypothetical protein
MSLSDLDLDAARNLSWAGIAIAVVVALLALKFAGSLVTKLLFLAGCAALGVLLFSQRDELNACAARFSTAAQSGAAAAAEVECRFFGRTVRLPDSVTGG